MDILYSEEIIITDIVYYLIIGAICVIGIGIATYLSVKLDSGLCAVIGIFLTVFLACCFAVRNDYKYKTNTGKYRYMATIENTDFNEIHDKYDVVDRKGKIWTLEEK